MHLFNPKKKCERVLLCMFMLGRNSCVAAERPLPSLSCSAGRELCGGEAQLRGSGRKGAEHMICLCQNGNTARLARIPNGIFQNLKSMLLIACQENVSK